MSDRETRWTIGRKITLGFSVVLIGVIVVSLWSDIGIRGIVVNASEVIAGNQLRGEMIQREVDHLNWAAKLSEFLHNDSVTELTLQTDPHKCGFGSWYYSEARQHAESLVPTIASDLRDIEAWHNQLHESAMEIGEVFHQADLELNVLLQQKKVDHLNWTHHVKDAFIDKSLHRVDVETDARKCGFGRWLYSPDTQQRRAAKPAFDRLCADVEKTHQGLHAGAIHVNEFLGSGQREEAAMYYAATIKPQADETLVAIDAIIAWNDEQVHGMRTAQAIFVERSQPALREVQRLLASVREKVTANVMTDEQMLKSASQTRWGVITTSAVAGIVSIVLAILIVSGTKKVLARIANALTEGAAQVSSASVQVSSASQNLAQGSAEQAASIEETSSSIEEMAAMTRQNASNAEEANGLAGTALASTERGREAMTRMSDAISEIKQSSDDTAKIVRTIDEIAFQTNLLALNAAVEAARAGEAGKGFAVVAEEVRNLAQRSAEAAKSTSELIELSVGKAGVGVSISEEVATALNEIGGGAQQVNDLLGQIAAASKEQSEGISQINAAVSQMDQVVQSNAANSEETAAAAEELSGQALELDRSVNELLLLVHGNTRSRRQHEIATSHHAVHEVARPRKLSAPPESSQAREREADLAANF